MLRPCRLVLIAGVLLVAPVLTRTPASAATDQAPASSTPPLIISPPAAPPAPPAEPVSIDGFRSAHFGMTEAEVRKAIEADFKLSGAAVRPGENPVERTRLLSVIVPALVPDSGKAVVDYVFGFKTHRLIEVNVRWTTADDPANKPDTLLHTGMTLQNYFHAEAFTPGNAVVNAMLGNGRLLLFRGTDPDGHVVVLILSGTVRENAKEHKAQMTPTVLSLVYAADPEHPDVFHLQKGTF
jgi:hypothetical protein